MSMWDNDPSTPSAVTPAAASAASSVRGWLDASETPSPMMAEAEADAVIPPPSDPPSPIHTHTLIGQPLYTSHAARGRYL